MNFASSTTRSSVVSNQTILIALALVVVGVATGCGGNGMASGTGVQKLSGNTSVTVLLSSTANDQLTQFDLQFQTLTLTSQSGKTVNLLIDQKPAETIHLNSNVEPLATITIPQDIYTSATATIGGASFTCVTIVGPGYDITGSLDTSTYAYGYTPNANVTVNLPSPVTVTGDSMGLSLNLAVSQSATFESCYPSNSYSITPTFNLTAANLSASPTNPGNGKATGVQGEVTALGASAGSFTVSVNEYGSSSRTFAVTANGSTAYQGISNADALQVGSFVEMDGAIQVDGSLLATRIAVYDLSALNVMIGPLLYENASAPVFYSYARQQQGQDYSVQPAGLGIYSFSNSTSFQVSGQLNNVASLPFTASFKESNMVPGQNVAVYSLAITAFDGGQTTAVTTMTLLPQTLNGTVLSSSTSGNFSVYSVLLSPYDLFPTLSVQQGQNTLLTNPNQMEVYVDDSAQRLNTTALAAGSTLRFNGLVFNDNGTLRMDCGQINDGIVDSAQSNAKARMQMETGQAQYTRHEVPSGSRQVNTVVTRSH